MFRLTLTFHIGALVGFFRSYSFRYLQQHHTFLSYSWCHSHCTLDHGATLDTPLQRHKLTLYCNSFYCIILLTALFTSSCYWQPVPTDAIIGSIFPNGSVDDTRFHVLSGNISQEASDPWIIPKLTLLNDRCWCDLSGTSLFKPFNTTRWQLDSFARTVVASNTQAKQLRDADESEPVPESTEPIPATPQSEDSATSSSNKKWIVGIVSSNIETFPSSLSLSKWLLRPFAAFKSRNSTTNVSSIDVDQTPERLPPVEISTPTPDPSTKTFAHIIRSTYDLRPYGMDLIVDFQWPRNSLNVLTTSTTDSRL